MASSLPVATETRVPLRNVFCRKFLSQSKANPELRQRQASDGPLSTVHHVQVPHTIYNVIFSAVTVFAVLQTCKKSKLCTPKGAVPLSPSTGSGVSEGTALEKAMARACPELSFFLCAC